MPAHAVSLLQKLLSSFILGSLFAAFLPLEATAQTASPTPAKSRRTKEAPAANPQVFEYVPVKKPGMLDKLFKKKPTPAPTPTVAPPAATPTPRPKKRKSSSRSEKPTPSPTASDPAEPGIEPNSPPTSEVEPAIPLSSPTSVPTSSPSGDRLPDSLPPLPPLSAAGEMILEPTPVPVETTNPVVLPEAPASAPPTVITNAPPSQAVRNNPLNQPIPLLNETAGSESISVPSAEASREKEMLDRLQFRKVKSKALEDASLQKLQQATETAQTPADRYAALKKYYPKLFASMRKIDANLSVQIDEMEAAARRRLERMEADELANSGSR